MGETDWTGDLANASDERFNGRQAGFVQTPHATNHNVLLHSYLKRL